MRVSQGQISLSALSLGRFLKKQSRAGISGYFCFRGHVECKHLFQMRKTVENDNFAPPPQCYDDFPAALPAPLPLALAVGAGCGKASLRPQPIRAQRHSTGCDALLLPSTIKPRLLQAYRATSLYIMPGLAAAHVSAGKMCWTETSANSSAVVSCFTLHPCSCSNHENG